MKTDDLANYGTVLSYATETEDNELTFTDYGGFVLSVKGEYYTWSWKEIRFSIFFFCRAKSGDRYHSQWRDVDLFMCPLEIFARSLGHFCQWPINGQWTTFSRESTSIQWRSFSFRSRTRCSRWTIFFCWILSWPIDQIELLDTVFDRSWNQPSNE